MVSDNRKVKLEKGRARLQYPCLTCSDISDLLMQTVTEIVAFIINNTH